MKILHINCNYTGNRVHRTMIAKLSQYKEIDNFVFCPVYKDNYSIKSDNKITVSECFNKWDRFLFDYKSRKIRKAVINNYNLSNIDIIHAYTLFTDGNVAYKLNKKYNIPYVVAIRNTDVNTFMKYMIHLRKRGIEIMRNASAIFFLSQSYKEQVFKKYIPNKFHDELEKKVYIIPNGIDDFWIENKYLGKKVINKDKEINIIYAGRIDANKNIETTQKALAILRERGYKTNFTIVGKIEDKKVFDKIIKYECTKYHEPVPKEKLKELYRQNDIFVMPSFTETFGLAYIEAMSQGLPVIYTKNQGIDSYFKDGQIGYSVIPNSENNIVKGIISIINNYSYISKNCVDVSINFDWDKVISQYIKIYERIG